MKLVVAGVSGSGKSTIGAILAQKLGAEFLDADSCHPPENIRKMSQGIPLTDKDRAGWIEALGAALSHKPHLILACSALKKAYRDRLKEWEPATQFALLILGKEQLEERLRERAKTGHFMSPTLLDSQLSTLETGPDVTQFENTRAPEEIATNIINTLSLRLTR